MKLKRMYLLTLPALLLVLLALTACMDDDDNNGTTSSKSASDYVDSDIREFGEKLYSSFDKHMEALNALPSNATISDRIRTSHQVHLDHFGIPGTLTDAQLTQIASVIAEGNANGETFDKDFIQSLNVSNNEKRVLLTLSDVLNFSGTHQSFQENLANYAESLQNANLTDGERTKIQMLVVSLEQRLRYLHENQKTYYARVIASTFHDTVCEGLDYTNDALDIVDEVGVDLITEDEGGEILGTINDATGPPPQPGCDGTGD